MLGQCNTACLMKSGATRRDSGSELQRIADKIADRIRAAARLNRTSLIVELYRFDRMRRGSRPYACAESFDQINQAVWVNIVNDPQFRSDRAGWVLF